MFLWFQSTMLQGIERYMKQAIVDKTSAVSSAALTSALVRIFTGFVCFHCVAAEHSGLALNISHAYCALLEVKHINTDKCKRNIWTFIEQQVWGLYV